MSATRAPSVHPIADTALGNTSYLITLDPNAAVVVDPRRDIAPYLMMAETLDVAIMGVLETHLHADFVSGARELTDATGAVVYGAADARLAFDHTPVHPGSTLALGGATIRAMATPGHTPEHLSYLVTHESGSSLFSGGSLIVGGAARTDLTGPGSTHELARAQFASLRSLAALPDDTALYPTHGAGSFCSTGPARSAISTLGAERASNPLLAITDEDRFVETLLAGFGSYPSYFSSLRALNRVGAALLRDVPEAPQLRDRRALSAAADGAVVVDGRPIAAWAAAHPTGAVSIEVRPAFASWLGWAAPVGAPLLFIVEPEQIADALLLAHRIGYDDIRGWSTFDSWHEAGLPTSSAEVVEVAEALHRQERGTVLLDVRQRAEFDARHIPGAQHLELGDIIAGKVPDASEVVVYCGHGERSATAVSLLQARGISAANMAGGTGAWERLLAGSAP